MRRGGEKTPAVCATPDLSYTRRERRKGGDNRWDEKQNQKHQAEKYSFSKAIAVVCQHQETKLQFHTANNHIVHQQQAAVKHSSTQAVNRCTSTAGSNAAAGNDFPAGPQAGAGGLIQSNTYIK